MRMMRAKKCDYYPYPKEPIYMFLTEDEAKLMFNLAVREDQSRLQWCKANKLDCKLHEEYRRNLCDGLHKMLVKPDIEKKGGKTCQLLD